MGVVSKVGDFFGSGFGVALAADPRSDASLVGFPPNEALLTRLTSSAWFTRNHEALLTRLTSSAWSTRNHKALLTRLTSGLVYVRVGSGSGPISHIFSANIVECQPISPLDQLALNLHTSKCRDITTSFQENQS